MYSRISVLIVLVISSFFFSACNDEPTSAGLSILNKEDLITVNPDSTFLVSASPFSANVNTLGGSPLLLGRYQNVKSTMLVQFSIALPDTIKKGIKANTIGISSAWVEMRPVYKIGNTGSQFDFSVYKITAGWPSTNSFNSDSLARITKTETNLKTQNNFSADTLYSFNLNAQPMPDWFKDTTNLTASFYFDPSSAGNGIVGFQPLSGATTLTEMKMKVVFEKSGAYKDTITFTPVNNRHLIEQLALPNAQTDRILVQGGIGYHSRLKFDISRVPENSIINNATLELTMDSVKSTVGNPQATALTAVFLYDTTKFAYDSTAVFTLNKTGNVFSGNIGPIVQRWNLKHPNNGIAIAVQNEKGTVDLISLMGKNTANKPKLSIIYTTKKQ